MLGMAPGSNPHLSVGPEAAASFTSALSGTAARRLLDHAKQLTRHGLAYATAAAAEEACDIARNLRCQPLLDRAVGITPAKS
jgi:hypothetical protein